LDLRGKEGERNQQGTSVNYIMRCLISCTLNYELYYQIKEVEMRVPGGTLPQICEALAEFSLENLKQKEDLEDQENNIKVNFIQRGFLPC
jgi:hypothetical protein